MPLLLLRDIRQFVEVITTVYLACKHECDALQRTGIHQITPIKAEHTSDAVQVNENDSKLSI